MALLGLAVLAVACSSDSPSEPSQNPPPTPSPGQATFAVTVVATPNTLTAGSDESSQVLVRFRRIDNGAAPPNGTTAVVRTTLGSFGSLGSGVTQVVVELIGGDALIPFFAGDTLGTAVISAQLEGSIGQVGIQIVDQTTFFLSFVEPSTGSPSGGEEVTIRGGGIERPVRVTFGTANAQVLSASSGRIRVITPASPQPVPAGQTLPVQVTVTVRVNEADQATDVLANGFTYVAGGGPINRPVVFSVDPPNGPNEGGTRVEITGERFEPPVQVLFGMGTADSFQGVEGTLVSASANRIVVNTPPAGGLGVDNRNQLVDVLVRNVNSGFATVAQDSFRYGNPLNISSISPLQGPAQGGTTVTISGSGFVQPLQVIIAGVEQEVLSVTPSQITIRTVGVVVLNCPSDGVVVRAPIEVRLQDSGGPTGGTAVQSDQDYQFVVPLPQVTAIDPNSGSQGGGLLVDVSGSGFVDPVQVRFTSNGQAFAGNVQTVSSNTISVRTPAVTDSSFDQVTCGNMGMRFVDTAFDIQVENLSNGCVSNVLPNAFIYSPTDTSCRGEAPVAPIASFDFTVAGLMVSFTNTSTNNPTSFLWDFGDASPTSTQASPTHNYAAAGTYTVTLTATNAAGSSNAMRQVTVP